MMVSIHAPARGATPVPEPVPEPEKVSIHAPARGATLGPSLGRCCTGFRFNPRPREGGDHAAYQDGEYSNVSIHAPARGATCRGRGSPRSHCCFNPRPREGGDLLGHLRNLQVLGFQSTPPARGATPGCWASRIIELVSIHAPARGATAPSSAYRRTPLVSIHAPARGATEIADGERLANQFQSTPPRGGRRLAQE